jgi:hypothetical protein
MIKNYATLKFVCFAALPAIVLELAFPPFSMARAYLHYAWLPAAQLALTGIILPLYLASLGSWFFRHGTRSLIVLSVVVATVFLAVFLNYFGWGVSTGRFWAPDPGTRDLNAIIAVLALGVSLAPLAPALVFRHNRGA